MEYVGFEVLVDLGGGSKSLKMVVLCILEKSSGCIQNSGGVLFIFCFVLLQTAAEIAKFRPGGPKNGHSSFATSFHT